MSEAEKTGLDVELFRLQDGEVARVLEAGRLTPGGGSPLAGASLDPGNADPGVAETLPQAVMEAMARVARPHHVLALATCTPPTPAKHLWFYARDGDLDYAFYSGEAGRGHHLAWPVDGISMLELATAPLALGRGTEPTALSLAVGPEEFCTLCALSDFLRQETLRGLLTPVPTPASLPAFSLEELTAAAARAGTFSDPGWMIPRAQLLAPVPLDFGQEALAAGMVSLRESGLLILEGGRTEVTPLLHRLSLQMGACEGFTAVSNWRRHPDSGEWGLEHFALSRSPGSLLLLEFQEISEPGFLVALDDVTPELAFHWLHGSLPVPGAGAWTEEGEEDAPKEKPMAAPRFCTVCGKPLEAGKRFCTGCGTPVKEAGAHD